MSVESPQIDPVLSALAVPSPITAPQAQDDASSRRNFLGMATAVAATAATVGLLGTNARAQGGGGGPVPAGDIAILKFLAAAELLEDDLWAQYAELATNNAGFHDALSAIDPSLPRYIRDDRNDERSHALLINAYLASIGETPVNLDPFRTLPSARTQGAEQRGRLTNLTNLTVDTSWFFRYRGAGNPDFGDTFPQLVNITGRSTIPTSNALNANQLQTLAHSAAFHFCAIEQGGSSLYSNLIIKAQHPVTKRILSSIGPTEVYHFAVFHKTLEGVFGFTSGDGLVFPDLRSNQALAEVVMPQPCKFLNPNFPLCSIIRPTGDANAGAVAAAVGLLNSGLFKGQSRVFINAAVGLATAADAAG